jgi:hypothetical protein
LPTLRTPACAELATTLPGRSGIRRSPLMVLGEFHDEDGFIGRADCWWPRQRVVGEFDGKGKYLDAAVRGDLSAEQAVYREKLREDRIRGLGLGFVRWGWADVENPDRLRRKLLAAGLRPVIRGWFAHQDREGAVSRTSF